MVPAPETDSASAWCAEARRHLGLAPLDKQSIVDGRDTAGLAKDLAGIDKALASGKLDLSGTNDGRYQSVIGALPTRGCGRPPSATAMQSTISSGRGASATRTVMVSK